ncbi:putative esterase [Mycobacteroides abscessus subsp. bolletii]|uniref:Esterase n=1 Tax=Mycobacteroides abscessus subsp. bolletii TaxID=319705 RepID=A0A9Q7WJZ8_9MYCO|nr:alpha/beta hydrolase fold domain-containing protein [Mycobacteroides abscessus]SHT97675.1 putative esterase [Mycobacteroides abscessus subsp. bolletii]SHU63127.1 putative esterase [Mycobacteroides abscessus subsp. bolletii]SHU79735.1 putative esterase [Mycobacteroides abscessus subsp. bolletii]SHW79016.1 putative esterase [Mycobacteroides abscessus subsp. bolletii]SHX39357.1 putative esterase [Mycobacteroides abscessus subsp. bolletii]
MTDPAHKPAFGDTVTIETVGSDSAVQRSSHAVARALLRPALELLARIAARHPKARTHGFRAANFVELAAYPLRPSRGTRRRMVTFDQFRAEWLWHKDLPDPDQTAQGAILYFHGGAFILGGLHSHRRIAARLARASGIPVLVVDYRQLPLAHITDSITDAVDSYRYLLDRGHAPGKIVFAGDSAGGGLAFSAALAARDEGLPVPGGIAAISPWADLDCSAKRAHPNEAHDAMLSGFILSVPGELGMARGNGLDPAWSAVNHDFNGMPAVFIQVGSLEVLRVDVDLLARRCAEAHVPCTVQVWKHAIHDFQLGADLLPDARAAVGDMAHFIYRITDPDNLKAGTP